MGGKSQGLTFSFLQLLASSSFISSGDPAGSGFTVPHQSTLQSAQGEGPASALISGFIAKPLTFSRWESNYYFGFLVVKDQRRNHPSHSDCDLGRSPVVLGGPAALCSGGGGGGDGFSRSFTEPACVGKGSGRSGRVSTLPTSVQRQ